VELAARLILALAAMAALSLPLRAQDAEARAGHLIVSGASARATPPGATVGAIYLTITNSGATADVLESVSSPAARSVQLHATSVVNGVMQMRAVQAVECPAGATLKAEPGGLHVMLIGLAAPLTLGTSLDVSLKFHAAGVLTLKVPVT
jgi:periplasmic copper chaperone A